MRKEHAAKLHNGDEVIIKGTGAGEGLDGESATVKSVDRHEGPTGLIGVTLHVTTRGNNYLSLSHTEVK